MVPIPVNVSFCSLSASPLRIRLCGLLFFLVNIRTPNRKSHSRCSDAPEPQCLKSARQTKESKSKPQVKRRGAAMQAQSQQVICLTQRPMRVNVRPAPESDAASHQSRGGGDYEVLKRRMRRCWGRPTLTTISLFLFESFSTLAVPALTTARAATPSHE